MQATTITTKNKFLGQVASRGEFKVDLHHFFCSGSVLCIFGTEKKKKTFFFFKVSQERSVFSSGSFGTRGLMCKLGALSQKDKQNLALDVPPQKQALRA